MSLRPLHPFRVLQLVCAFLLLHHSNWQASMVSGHQQSTTRVLQHKSGDLLGGEVTMCERTLNTDYAANLTECKEKAAKLFPGTVEDIDVCKRKYSQLWCQTELACQHCDDSLQDWLTKTQTSMNSIIRDFCQDSSDQFHPFMCPITVAPTTTTTSTSTTHNSTTRAQFPKWAIYTLASGVIIVIVLVLLILWYGWSRLHPHASFHHHESDSKQSLKSTRIHKSSSSHGSGSQANQHQHTAKSLKWNPQNKAIKKATKATPTLKKASSGKVASRGKVTTSSPRRHEAKQKHHSPLGPKMVNPRAHSTGNVKKGH